MTFYIIVLFVIIGGTIARLKATGVLTSKSDAEEFNS